MRFNGESSLYPVRKAGAENDQQPGNAWPHQSGGEVPKPDSGKGIGGEVSAINVQSECSPDSPPLSLPDQTGIELSHIERIQPPKAVGDRQCNAGKYCCIRHAPNPGA